MSETVALTRLALEVRDAGEDGAFCTVAPSSVRSSEHALPVGIRRGEVELALGLARALLERLDLEREPIDLRLGDCRALRRASSSCLSLDLAGRLGALGAAKVPSESTPFSKRLRFWLYLGREPLQTRSLIAHWLWTLSSVLSRSSLARACWCA